LREAAEYADDGRARDREREAAAQLDAEAAKLDPPPPPGERPATAEQIAYIQRQIATYKLDAGRVLSWMGKACGVSEFAAMKQKHINFVVPRLRRFAQQVQAEAVLR
jgi:hypothetical protein